LPCGAKLQPFGRTCRALCVPLTNEVCEARGGPPGGAGDAHLWTEWHDAYASATTKPHRRRHCDPEDARRRRARPQASMCGSRSRASRRTPVERQALRGHLSCFDRSNPPVNIDHVSPLCVVAARSENHLPSDPGLVRSCPRSGCESKWNSSKPGICRAGVVRVPGSNGAASRNCGQA
jgi:hypothetical protein